MSRRSGIFLLFLGGRRKRTIASPIWACPQTTDGTSAQPGFSALGPWRGGVSDLQPVAGGAGLRKLLGEEEFSSWVGLTIPSKVQRYLPPHPSMWLPPFRGCAQFKSSLFFLPGRRRRGGSERGCFPPAVRSDVQQARCTYAVGCPACPVLSCQGCGLSSVWSVAGSQKDAKCGPAVAAIRIGEDGGEGGGGGRSDLRGDVKMRADDSHR